ncbi:hypothetical protein GCM10010211_51760 [Streptomyces albospinus]|uniref:Histidine kinase/HSP90-like ATPase domain-containing protein n=1 Tax=Streptomyces albospinus TaxID=285515 RepID=A0ABQ2VDY0_9ACTN|nr:ATP-binding protein [Streptomyces albospinus]GGU79387.1 hypothetical protein GCM10010211_51760 [Streptomyces albospinus]
MRLWDAATGKSNATLTGHTNEVWSVAFSPDGRTLATGSVDTTARLWDVATGRTRAILPGDTGGLASVVFSPDGHTLATASDDSTVRLWDVILPKPAAVPQQIGRIRRIVTAFLRYWGWDQWIDPAVLCVTEMLSNVQRHADSDDCVLLLQASPSGVRIVVSDDSQVLPVLREPDWLTERGRGMFLLSKSADAWGADLTPQGKDVWIEFWGREAEESREAIAALAQPRWSA